MVRKQNLEIIQLGKKLQTLARKAVTQYKPEMDEIINSGCRDKRRIECVLDGMLDFCFDENLLGLYKKLCRHYYFIDPHATAEYVFAYRDMWDPRTSTSGGVQISKLNKKK